MAQLNDLLRTLKTAETKKKADAEAAYWRFVRAAATGEEVDPMEVAGVLDVLDVGADELANDARRLESRLALQKTVDAGPLAAKKLAAMNAEHEARTVEFRAAEKVFNQHAFQVHHMRGHYAAEIGAGEKATADLIDGCPYPTMAERRENLRHGVKTASWEIEAARKRLDDARATLRGTEVRDAAAIDRAAGTLYSDDVARGRRRVAELEQKVEEARAAHARVEAALAAHEKEMAKP